MLDELQQRILINMRLLSQQYGIGTCTLDRILSRNYHSHHSPWPETGIEHAFEHLKHSGFIHETEESFVLTSEGEELALQLLESFFSKTIKESMNSHSAKEWRKALYGIDLYQHNISTEHQFLMLQSVLQPGPSKRLLDLGCGAGGIAEFFSKSGAMVTGIDLAEELIQDAQNRARLAGECLIFINRDISKFEPSQEYDGIYSIDALQFLTLKQQITVLKRMYKALAPNGVMTFLYSERLDSNTPGENPKRALPQHLRIGQAFEKAGISYNTVDFCDEYIPFWKRQSELARDFLSKFQSEDLEHLCHERLSEGQRALKEILSGKKMFGRYLYIVRKTA
ncbi:MAG: methyltransferase domain-containing protein [Gammaproteobacteria bacterium]|nr:methyltransferase domain-containing protein [Gammaproteobacteria bacterium]